MSRLVNGGSAKRPGWNPAKRGCPQIHGLIEGAMRYPQKRGLLLFGRDICKPTGKAIGITTWGWRKRNRDKGERVGSATISPLRRDYFTPRARPIHPDFRESARPIHPRCATNSPRITSVIHRVYPQVGVHDGRDQFTHRSRSATISPTRKRSCWVRDQFTHGGGAPRICRASDTGVS